MRKELTRLRKEAKEGNNQSESEEEKLKDK